jgi:hypothetical protein
MSSASSFVFQVPPESIQEDQNILFRLENGKNKQKQQEQKFRTFVLDVNNGVFTFGKKIIPYAYVIETLQSEKYGLSKKIPLKIQTHPKNERLFIQSFYWKPISSNTPTIWYFQFKGFEMSLSGENLNNCYERWFFRVFDNPLMDNPLQLVYDLLHEIFDSYKEPILEKTMTI